MSKDDEECKQFQKDPKAQEAVENTLKLADIDESKYAAIFYVGGHGPCLDLADDATSIKLIETFYNSGRTTAAVCHAPIVFNKVKGKDGKSIVDGRTVTAFSTVEEQQADKVR